jgi:polysaccharide export outer membrane protein
MVRWIAAFLVVLAALLAAHADAPTIVPGDVLVVTVLGEDQISGKFTVAADGTLSVPLAGSLAVEGLGCKQASERLAEKLAAYVKQPRVTVEMAERAKIRVLLTGTVKTPGVYLVAPGTRVSELVVVSGGPAEKADLAAIRVVRSQGGLVACDLIRVAEGNIAFDPIVMNGDQVIVPVLAVERSVRVLGEVAKPGTYPVMEPMPLWEALAVAGGLLPTASPGEAMVTKASGQIVAVDLAKLLTAQGVASGAMLEPGDTLTIPSASTRIYVLGAVQKPGVVALPKGSRLHEALAAAGGLTTDARPGDAYILRSQAQRPGQVERIAVSLDRLLQKGDFRQNVALESGDAIVVPQSRRRDSRDLLQKVAPILGPLLYAIF